MKNSQRLGSQGSVIVGILCAVLLAIGVRSIFADTLWLQICGYIAAVAIGLAPIVVLILGR